ncbi:MAG: flagellar biosynthetic protein FliO [Thermoguttaceae bacterium]
MMRLAGWTIAAALILFGADPVGVLAAPSGHPAATTATERPSSLALTPPSAKARDGAEKASTGSSAVTTVVSLAVVLGVFFLGAWLYRRSMPQARAPLPQEAFAVLGRAPLAYRHQAQLVRCGNKLLLVCVTAAGAETLTEITDPAEVERLLGVCGVRCGQSAGGDARPQEVGDA